MSLLLNYKKSGTKFWNLLSCTPSKGGGGGGGCTPSKGGGGGGGGGTSDGTSFILGVQCDISWVSEMVASHGGNASAWQDSLQKYIHASESKEAEHRPNMATRPSH